MSDRPLSVITGASSGIGFELAKLAAADGHDLVICANEPRIRAVASELEVFGGSMTAVEVDLDTLEGVQRLTNHIRTRTPDYLMANAGVGVGGAFLDQPIRQHLNVVNVNVGATIALLHSVGRKMCDADHGRILVIGSIIDDIPGPFNSVYNASKAFIDSFCDALRHELKDSQVSVTCLMPGLTDTAFFERADMENTFVGKTRLKDDPAKVAKDGYEAMMKGEAIVVGGNVLNKVQSLFSEVLPDRLLAELHSFIAKPKS